MRHWHTARTYHNRMNVHLERQGRTLIFLFIQCICILNDSMLLYTTRPFSNHTIGAIILLIDHGNPPRLDIVGFIEHALRLYLKMERDLELESQSQLRSDMHILNISLAMSSRQGSKIQTIGHSSINCTNQGWCTIISDAGRYNLIQSRYDSWLT